MSGLSLTVSHLAWAFDASAPTFLTVPTLSLKAGETVALSGHSGAGKSTLLFVLAGLEPLPPGVVAWGDFDLGAARESQRDRWRRQNLGLVFQDFQLVPELTALHNVLLPLTFSRLRVTRTDRARAEDLLDRFGVTRSRARASTLSRGELQRTALARALFARPQVLLADEPTASLDAENERVVADALWTYARDEGATVLVATHQPGVAAGAQRHLRLDRGHVSEVLE